MFKIFSSRRAVVIAASLAASASFASSAAQATTVLATFTSAAPVGALVERNIVSGPGAPQLTSQQQPERFYMVRSGGTDTHTLVGTGMVDDFFGFCMEPREFIYQGGLSQWDVVSLKDGASNLGGIGTAKARQIQELFGRFAPDISAPMTALTAGALQLSIWEIVRETPGNPLDVYNGNIYYTGENTPGMIALAQSYVQAIDGFGPRSHRLLALRAVGTQDIVVQAGGVPEPSSWVMLIAGFGLIGATARRRHRVVAA